MRKLLKSSIAEIEVRDISAARLFWAAGLAVASVCNTYTMMDPEGLNKPCTRAGSAEDRAYARGTVCRSASRHQVVDC